MLWSLIKWDKCNKCKSNVPVIILRHKDVYCKECFLSGAAHKFKAFIGKNHLVKKNDFVLVCFRSGHSSVSLLHMLRSALDLQTPKKLKLRPIVIYIAKATCEPQFLKEIEDVVCSFNFPLYFISFNQYISNGQELDKVLFANFRQMLENYPQINSFKRTNNPTATQTLERIYEQQLLTEVAKHLNCSIVFVPDISLNVATNLLTSISLGRGAYLPLDTGICDTRDPQITIVRPLRHFDDKELAFYNVYNKLKLVVSPNEIKKFNNTSVQDLIDTFVSNLQLNYPATITTVVRTGDKLALDKTVLKSKACNLCKAPLLNNTSEELNSATATDFSRWISAQLQIFKKDESFNEFEIKQRELYCYACSKIIEFVEK
ncbi:cytoplasmic tRNA 2-thiolation protein 2 isoform X3 [Agrilus planipennis]|uniref:Cytoplasmic tRNA 2-thiolation protein 2 n=1 Tax=Agrilus planipennis TaxID=224129 RepID=A0A7F5RJU6_AGRPL|nr:cytoplasmic tRNA 2-thiolation protein 2 isoform X3 [Agrilus planipennis]